MKEHPDQQLIDWTEIEWTAENVAAFFTVGDCGDPECQHVHSHFEEARAIAFGLLDELETGDQDADQAGENIEALQETLAYTFAATAALAAFVAERGAS